MSLRLFLSADLAGSTAFKQVRPAVEWQRFFQQFYRQLPVLLETHTSDDAGRLTLWKTVGDEIVFSAELSRSTQVPVMVATFRNAVAQYRAEIRKTHHDLDIKCAGWTAGFPVGNLTVELPGSPPQCDYVGPGMDIGFRLVKEASPRRMLLSVELAYILSLEGFGDPRIIAGHSMELKGVGKGRRYPCLWLDSFLPDDSHGWDHIELKEEKLRGGLSKVCSPKDVHEYCRSWMTQMGLPFVVPFIEGDEFISQPPPGYAAWLREIHKFPQGAEDIGSTEELQAGDSTTGKSPSLDEFFPEPGKPPRRKKP